MSLEASITSLEKLIVALIDTLEKVADGQARNLAVIEKVSAEASAVKVKPAAASAKPAAAAAAKPAAKAEPKPEPAAPASEYAGDEGLQKLRAFIGQNYLNQTGAEQEDRKQKIASYFEKNGVGKLPDLPEAKRDDFFGYIQGLIDEAAGSGDDDLGLG